MVIRFLLLLLVLAGTSAQGQTYRCEHDGTIVFSDRPCSVDAVVYAPLATVSVVPSADDLDQIAAANQAFIQARLDRQAAERRDRQRRAESRQHPVVVHTPPPQPIIMLPRYRHSYGQGRQRHPNHRASAEEENRQQAFSALSGPWPGSRRSARSDP